MSAFAELEGDLDLSGGNLRVEKDPDLCTAQKLTNRFRLFLGEWFIDTRIGIPYFQLVFVKNPNLQVIAQLFKRVCLQTPRVLNVLSESLNFFNGQRSLICEMKVQTESGAVLVGGPGLPFIVDENSKGTA